MLVEIGNNATSVEESKATKVFSRDFGWIF